MKSRLHQAGGRIAWLSLWLLSAGVSGCAKDACDPGQELRNHVCIALAAPATDAGSSDKPEQDAGTDAGPQGMFGAACTKDADCARPTNFCSIPPPQFNVPPFCTLKDCDKEDPLSCPSAWTCIDFSMTDDVPPFCLPPS